MSLPNFLVIGAQRSGSTWLHELLSSNPRLYMPTRRKEVRFFNGYYDRGTEWYQKFFPSDAEAGRYDAIGEVTPTYLYKAIVPRRIHETLPDAKLIVILRNPADRAFSHYLMKVRSNNYRGTFDQLLDEDRGVFDYGLYGHCISRVLELFDRSSFFALIYEEAVSDVEATKERIAAFLQTDASCFPSDAGYARVGGSFVPRARTAFAAGKSLSRWLQRRDSDWLVRFAKKSGAVDLLGKQREVPVLARETRDELLARYQEDIALLESLLSRDLSCWRARTTLQV